MAMSGRSDGPVLVAALLTVAAALFGLAAGVPNGVAVAGAAEARPAAISLTLSPADVSLVRGRPTDVLLILRNTSAEEALGVKVEPGPKSEALTVSVAAHDIPSIPVGASVAVRATVERVAETKAESLPLQLVVSYQQASPAGTTPKVPSIPQVTSISLAAKAIAPPELLEASFKANLGALSEDRAGEISLLLTNKNSGPVHVRLLEVIAPRSVIASVPADAVGNPKRIEVEAGRGIAIVSQEQPLEVPPHATKVVPIHLAATKTVDPGPRVLLVRMVARDGSPTAQTVSEPGTAARQPVDVESVISQDLKVEVFGESEILGALGVPMLMLLPGLIIIVTAAVLLRYVSPWRSLLSKGSVDITSKASFGVVASVFVSLLVVWAYPLLTDVLPGTKRNLRKSYGFDDFYYVYVWSIALAVIFWGLASAAKRGVTWAYFLQKGDKAWDVLRKLSYRKRPLTASVVTVENATGGTDLALHAAGADGRWYLVRPLKVTWGSVPSTDSHREAVEKALEGNDLSRVRKALLAAKEAGKASLDYEAGPAYIADVLVVGSDKASPNGQVRTVVGE